MSLAKKMLMAARSGGWGLSKASYDGVAFGVSVQDTYSYGIAFNNDGTKMYMLGNFTQSVYQYSLSTAFALSTASYDSVAFDVSGQDTDPTSIAFNNDGTQMYILGNANLYIYGYTLSTAFDPSTASYDYVTPYLGDLDTALTSIAFNNEGTKLYILGNASSTVYQLEFSTAFDFSTASYTGVTFSINGQDDIPYGIAISNDGTKMYLVSPDTQLVRQYSLSTASDLSTASYDGVAFSVSGQSNNPYSMAFNNDGTKMYILGGGTVYQYSLD